MIVKLNKITKSFGEEMVLKDLDLEIREGEKIALMGPSGCGKTTLAYLISGLLKPDKGSMKTTTSLSMDFQENRLLENFTVLENIQLVTDRSEEEIVQELEKLHLVEVADKKVRELSGGMKRRVGLLRALLHPSKLLILDESLREVDEKAAAAMMAQIIKYSQNRTLIYITHREEDLKFLEIDRIIKLEKGG